MSVVIDSDNNNIDIVQEPINVTISTGGADVSAVWGNISGDLTEQEDLQTALDGKVPYTGATQDVNLGEFGAQLGNLEFDTTPTNAPTGAGSVYWNDTDGTLNLVLKGGQVISKIGETQHIRALNNTGVQIARGKVVYVTGAQGQRLTVGLADADTELLSKDTIGITAEAINDGAEGFVIVQGVISNVNTNGMADGSTVYLSQTAGSYTTTAPVDPAHLVILGFIVNGNSGGAGSIYVKVDNGYELEELHNVSNSEKPTPVDADAVLLRDSADNSLWKRLTWANVKSTLKTYFDTLYQGTLTFDSTPTNGSTNPVTSDGVFDALALKQNNVTLTTTGTSGAATLVGTVLNIPQYQAALTNPVTGTGTSGQVSYWTGTNTQGGSAGFIFDAVNQRLGIGGVAAPTVPLEVIGTTTTDGGQLGTELLTSSNWTTTGWTGDFTNGFSHNTGNTDVLSNTLAAVNGTYYQITWTVTNRTAGTFTVAFGGQSSSGQSSSGNFGPRATTTGNLTITPTTDFNGTIVLSIKVVTAGTATLRLQSSAGTITNEVRSFTATSNTAVGLNAGSRITTGGNNSFFGLNAGLSNTTGSRNSFFGVQAGQNNTTGVQNSFFGVQAGQNNTTGTNNSFFGRDAGLSNTTGIQNSFFGVSAGLNNTTGGSNSFFGVSAGLSNTTGNNNSFFGLQAGLNKTTGGNNSFFGLNAGRYIANGSNLTVANNSVFIGYDTRAAADSQTNQTVIGYAAIGLGSNTTVIGNSSTTLTWLGGSTSIGTTTSSGRLTVRGSGTTSATNGLLIEDSGGTDTFTIRDDGGYAFKGGTVGLAQTGYTTFTNLTTDRTCDANATTVEELADILGTLIEDLKTKGIISA